MLAWHQKPFALQRTNTVPTWVFPHWFGFCRDDLGVPLYTTAVFGECYFHLNTVFPTIQCHLVQDQFVMAKCWFFFLLAKWWKGVLKSSKTFHKCLAINDWEGVNSSNQIPAGGIFKRPGVLSILSGHGGGGGGVKTGLTSIAHGQGPHSPSTCLLRPLQSLGARRKEY